MPKFFIVFLSFAVAVTIPASSQSRSSKAGRSTQVPTDAVLINAENLARFSPRARLDITNAIVSQWSAAKTAGITNQLRVQHFLTQMATETGGLRLLEEDLNYSAERMLVVFRNRVDAEQAQALAHKPIDLANHVYNNRLGNKPPMDGWTYRGSGLIQLTGRANFRDRGKELKLPFEDNPDMVRSTSTALNSAAAFWKARGINAAADQDNVADVRLLVNGGDRGLPEAKIWLARAKRVFVPLAGPGSAQQASFEEMEAVRQRLSDLNFLQLKPNQAPQRDQVEQAIKMFQASRGLAPTGLYDDDTLYELTSPDNFKD